MAETASIAAAAAAAAKQARYNELKEAFISNHYGSTKLKVFEVVSIAPLSVLLWSILQARQRFFIPYTAVGLLVDFLLSCCAMLAACTIYGSSPGVLLGLLFLPAVSIFVNHRPHPEAFKVAKPPSATTQTDKKSDEPSVEPLIDAIPIRPFITHYRGALLIATCICILAVDFPVFPREFAKTESIGTSLMDLGVGSFVFSSGVVSVRNILREQEGEIPRTSFVRRFANSFRHSIPLIVLGLVRLYLVKSLDYIEHVTEYGVHWNFFFTLATIPPFVAVFQTFYSRVPSYNLVIVFGYVVSLIHQQFFTWTDLLLWLVRDNRHHSWIAANKEGLISIPGYLAIFLVGQGLGLNILPRDQDSNDLETENDLWLAQTLGGDEARDKTKQAKQRFAWINLAKLSGIWLVLLYFHTGPRGPRLVPSRRFANLAYVVWVCSFNTIQLWFFCTVEMALFPDIYGARYKKTERERVRKATSKVLGAFNRNGLFLFLIANLLTGAINMTVRTIDVETIPAMALLTGYIAVLTGSALALDQANVSIKL